MRKLSLLLTGLLLVTTILAACDSGTPDDAGTVVSKYLQAVKEGRFSDAYKLLTPDSQAKITAEEYAKRMADSQTSAGITDTRIVSVGQPITTNNQASVPYSVEITLKDGSKNTQFESALLLRQGNNWLLVWPFPTN